MNVSLLLLACVMLFNTFDVFATMIAVDRGVTESNPFARYLIENFTFGGLWAFKMILVIFLMIVVERIRGIPLRFIQFTFAAYLMLTLYHLWNMIYALQ